MRSLKPTAYEVSNVSRWYFIGVVLNIPPKATLAQVGETVVSRCFVGCLWQARKRCSNRCCCCGLHSNYASDVRPTDPLAARIECPSPTLAPGVVFCTSPAGSKYYKNIRVIVGDFPAVKLPPWWAEAITASAKIVTAQKRKTAYRRKITAILWFYRLR